MRPRAPFRGDESEAAVLELAEAMIGRGLSTSAAKQ